MHIPQPGDVTVWVSYVQRGSRGNVSLSRIRSLPLVLLYVVGI